MVRKIIHGQHNHISKRGQWARKYAKEIADEFGIKGAIKIARITAILSNAVETLPKEQIKKNIVLSSPRFDEYITIKKSVFDKIIKDLEKSERGYYNMADDFIVIHRPNSVRTALEIIKQLAPGRSTHLHNDLIANCFRFQDEFGNIRKFNKKELSRVRDELKEK